MAVADEIQSLEIALARRDLASLPGGYDGVLADDFEEVGQSGRVWSRAQILAAIAGRPPDPSIEFEDFTVEELAPGVWLARFDTVAGGVRAHRVSIWVRSGDGLRVRYHQGTRGADQAAGPKRQSG
jgi:hypothetical protein